MCIAYFPEIYPDELIYSVLARYFVRTGYLAYTFCAEDIFQDKRVRPDIEFLNVMKPEALELLCRDMTVAELVEKHTMFPYYAIRSLTGEYKKIEPDCREGVRAQLERMKELYKERNNLYEKQNDLKGQKWKIEKSLER